MNYRLRHRHVIAAGLWVLACSGRIVDAPGGAATTVRIDMQVPNVTMFGTQARQVISVMDSVVLTIRDSVRTQRESRPIGRSDSIVAFDVLVVPGIATFEAQIVSNNGSLLYAGGDTIDVTGDFVLEMTLQPRGPVLVILPDSIDVAQQDSFVVMNRGIDTLVWSLGLVTPNALTFSPTSGAVVGMPFTDADTLRVDSIGPGPQTYSVVVQSAVGFVVLKVRVS